MVNGKIDRSFSGLVFLFLRDHSKGITVSFEKVTGGQYNR